MTTWKIDPDGTNESHWVDFIGDNLEPDTDRHWMYAGVKFDGCIHLNEAGNVPYGKEYGRCGQKRDKDACDDYFHICDLDGFIAKLIQLRDTIKNSKLGEGWPD